MITQGGKRDGANMAVMSVYHPDIEDFISCKQTEGDIHNFNISVAVDTPFMEAVKADEEHPLIDPNKGTVVNYVRARDIFMKIVKGAWSNGEPGMLFIDRINVDNKVLGAYGPMIATNPCGEQPLLGYESCNLGSINLAKFVTENYLVPLEKEDWKKYIDWERLTVVVNTAVHFLDNVIDANDYSIPEIAQMTKATRKIGLGIMGFADLLVKLRISYDEPLAREVGSAIIEHIKIVADTQSLNLGSKRGTFPAWEDSQYKFHENYRNACRLTVAPTGTISMIAGCTSGIEPLFALVWRKQNILDGKTLYYVNKQFEFDAKEHGFYSEELMNFLANGGSLNDRPEVPRWIKDIYITAPEISPEAHVGMQAAFQQHVDSGISKTINFASDATEKDVVMAYMQAYESGCKGITVYRSGSREKEVLVNGHTSELVITTCECENPTIVFADGCESCKNCGWSACSI
jgi:ribonucleoside-diphosphate reductase alpha chain